MGAERFEKDDPAAAGSAPRTRFGLADELLVDAAPPPLPGGGRIGLALAILAIAFNQRPALSSLAPVLPEIARTLDIGAAFAGVLTTAPVFCLGLFGPLGPWLARRLGTEAATLVAVGILVVGLALRAIESAPVLLLGSLAAGAGIGVIGVLLPGLIKRDFPDRAGLMTGLYTAALCAGAAFGAGLTVPLDRVMGGGWPGALSAWAVPAAAAALVWLPWARVRPHAGPRAGAGLRGIWRDPLAWQVTGFMGLQSSLAYVVFGWLAVALQDRGLGAQSAGFVVSGCALAQTVTALLVPMAAAKRPDQRVPIAAVVAITAAGWAGMLFGPDALVWPFAIALGLGLGGCFSLALTVIVLRSADGHVATHLSGMAQTVGYMLAALGPLSVGIARDWSGGWLVPTGIFIALAAGATLFGLGAGRDRLVGAGPG